VEVLSLQKKLGSQIANPQTTNLQIPKKQCLQIATPQSATFVKVCKFNKLFKSVNLWICHLQNLFADCPPLLNCYILKGWESKYFYSMQIANLKHSRIIPQLQICNFLYVPVSKSQVQIFFRITPQIQNPNFFRCANTSTANLQSLLHQYPLLRKKMQEFSTNLNLAFEAYICKKNMYLWIWDSFMSIKRDWVLKPQISKSAQKLQTSKSKKRIGFAMNLIVTCKAVSFMLPDRHCATCTCQSGHDYVRVTTVKDLASTIFHSGDPDMIIIPDV
jgi:hypothetical protein